VFSECAARGGQSPSGGHGVVGPRGGRGLGGTGGWGNHEEGFFFGVEKCNPNKRTPQPGGGAPPEGQGLGAGTKIRNPSSPPPRRFKKGGVGKSGPDPPRAAKTNANLVTSG